MLALETEGPNPHVTFKLHKSWAGDDDYVPYYIVLDTFPFGPSRAMGVPYVPKHRFLADAAVPLIQCCPRRRYDPSYPPTPADGNGLLGGGPFGGQIGMPSYFMPEDDYSPMWHIGFAHWLEPASEVIKGFKRLKELRADGALEVVEFPPPNNVGTDNYDFDSLNAAARGQLPDADDHRRSDPRGARAASRRARRRWAAAGLGTCVSLRVMYRLLRAGGPGGPAGPVRQTAQGATWGATTSRTCR